MNIAPIYPWSKPLTMACFPDRARFLLRPQLLTRV
jgi:hypothetical protein